MMSRTYALVLYATMTAGCIYHAFHFYPYLSETIPADFDLDGNVLGKMARNALITLYLGLVGIVTVFFPVLGYGLRFIPVSIISLPNREHWLTGPQRNQSLRYLFTSLTYMGAATLIFLQSMFHASFAADITGAPPSTGLIVGLYVSYLLVHTITMMLRFRKPRKQVCDLPDKD